MGKRIKIEGYSLHSSNPNIMWRVEPPHHNIWPLLESSE